QVLDSLVVADQLLVSADAKPEKLFRGLDRGGKTGGAEQKGGEETLHSNSLLCPQSPRSTSMGSTRDERCAGRNDASEPATIASVMASVNNWRARLRTANRFNWFGPGDKADVLGYRCVRE